MRILFAIFLLLAASVLTLANESHPTGPDAQMGPSAPERQTEAEADATLDRARGEIEGQFRRLETELAQAELRADRAEQWLVRIRREVDGQLMPSLVGVHNRLTPPEVD